MMADLFAVCHSFNQLIRKILRMGSHKADALQSLHLFQHLKKLCKSHRFFQSLTVRVYVLPKKHYLRNTICNQTFHFFYNSLRLTASLTSSYIRNDTVTAEVIAAKHNIDARFKGIVSFCRKILHDLICTFPDIYYLMVGLEHVVKKLRIFKNIMSTKYKIYKRIGLFDLVHYMLLLHHTSKKNDLHVLVVIFQTVKMSQTSINLKIGILTNSTGIVDHYICFFVVLSVISDLIHDPGHSF